MVRKPKLELGFLTAGAAKRLGLLLVSMAKPSWNQTTHVTQPPQKAF